MSSARSGIGARQRLRPRLDPERLKPLALRHDRRYRCPGLARCLGEGLEIDV